MKINVLVERNNVRGTCTSRCRVQENKRPRFEEIGREDCVRREDREVLLQYVAHQTDCKDHPQSDRSSGVSSISRSSESDCDHEDHQDGPIKNCAEPIYGTKLLEGSAIRSWVI